MIAWYKSVTERLNANGEIIPPIRVHRNGSNIEYIKVEKSIIHYTYSKDPNKIFYAPKIQSMSAAQALFAELIRMEEFGWSYAENCINPKEKSCRQCKRPNDFGVKSCWWCETADPTQ